MTEHEKGSGSAEKRFNQPSPHAGFAGASGLSLNLHMTL